MKQLLKFNFTGTKILAAFLWIALVLCSLLVYSSYLNRNIAIYSVDEYHTINSSLDRYYGFDNDWLRVGEAGRLFGVFALPLAQYYMNKNMGGNADIASWWYPGGHYLRANFARTSPPDAKNLHSLDPNIQDYVHAMRFQQTVVLILSVVVAGFGIYRAYGVYGSLIYGSLALMSSNLLEWSVFFYNDIHLVAIFNFLVLAVFAPGLGVFRRAMWMIALFSLGLAAKLSMVAMAPLVWTRLIDEWMRVKKTHLLEFLFFSVFAAFFFFFVFTATAPSFTGVIDQQLSNFWNYSTGQTIFEPSGWFQLSRIFESISFGIVIAICFALVVILFDVSILDRYLVCLFFIAVFLLFTLQGLHIFVSRNVIIFELILSLISAIVISKFLVNRSKNLSVLISSFFVCMCIYSLIGNYKVFNRVHFQSLASSCSSVLNIGGTIIDGGSANSFEFPSAPFDLINLLPLWQAQAESFDCVFVARHGEAKQFSNYILPQTHSLVARHGNYFFFSQKSP